MIGRRQVWSGAVAVALMLCGAAHAQNGLSGVPGEPSSLESLNPIAPSGPWFEFSFGGPGSAATSGVGCAPSSGNNSVFLGSPPWTLDLPAGGGTLTVTDAFLHGDEFQVSDFGVPIGSTSAVAPAGTCGSDPAICVTDPGASKGFFALSAGAHSITLTATVSPFGDGCAFFRIDPTRVAPAMSVTSLVGLLGLLTVMGTYLLRHRRN